jgi:eukaryotic-like serine/threonine-protein kinase
MAVKSKILVVDDSRHVRDFFADAVLRPAGYQVLLAEDGLSGLRLVQEQRPDLIIADLQMPGMNGLDLKRALVANGNNTPLILVTAEGSESIASQATLAGVVGYLPKPVDVDVMLAAIDQALTVERLRRERAEALHALEKRVHQLETLQSMGRMLTAKLDLGQVLGSVVDSAVRLTGADSGRLVLLEERGAQLTIRAVRTPEDEMARAVREDCRDTLAIQVMSTNQALRWPLSADDTMRPGAPKVPVLYVPLRLRDKPLGVLSVESQQRRQRSFSEADVGPLLALADYAAIAIANARLFSEIQLQSYTDGLTGLHNRKHFFMLAEREYQRALRFKRTLSVVMVDIDHFKQVNDRYGHATGDQVIAEVAQRCRTGIRTIDLLGRYGGEEFVLCLPETDAAGAAHLAERLRQRIGCAPVFTLGGPLPITVSLGVASMGPNTLDATALIQAADAALLAAKQAGRNRVQVA